MAFDKHSSSRNLLRHHYNAADMARTQNDLDHLVFHATEYESHISQEISHAQQWNNTEMVESWQEIQVIDNTGRKRFK
jgi:hypothetical protein